MHRQIGILLVIEVSRYCMAGDYSRHYRGTAAQNDRSSPPRPPAHTHEGAWPTIILSFHTRYTKEGIRISTISESAVCVALDDPSKRYIKNKQLDDSPNWLRSTSTELRNEETYQY